MLTVGASVQLGNLLYASHVVSLRLRRARLPVLDRLEVTLAPGVRLEATPGDDAVVKLDGGEGEQRVFTGRISEVRQGLRGAQVVAHGGGWALARYRPSLCLEQVAVGDVIQQLCRDAEVDTGEVEQGPSLALYTADGRSTALEELPRLAHLLGAEAAFDDAGLLHVVPEGPGEDLALRYGRELVEVRSTTAPSSTTEWTATGEGAADARSPRGRWVATDFLGGAASAPGPGVRRRALPELRTVDDTRTAAAAWAARQAADATPVRLRTWMLPALAPGARLELHELPESLALAECRVSQVVHVLSAQAGAYTEVWGTARTGGMDLLGALAGLAGGLL